jgi:DNA-binding response OmpR family regulator
VGEATSSADHRRATVLVIEDDDSVAGFLRTFLETEGYDVRVATDGLGGLVKLHTGPPPDLAVVDLLMPDVDGIRVLEQLIEEGGGALPVPVVVVTGHPEGAVRCRELLDPDDVIEKPFDPDRLLARIEAHLGAPPADGPEEDT